MAEPLARALALVVAVSLVIAVGSALVALAADTGTRGTMLRHVLQLVALSAAWLLVNSPVEGRVLLVLAQRHGVTQADLLVLPPLLLAGLLAAVRLRR